MLESTAGGVAALAMPRPCATEPLGDALRALVTDLVETAGSGDAGPSLAMAAASALLWSRFLRADVVDPHWPDRDRFVVSDPACAPLLYALLHLSGHPDMTAEALRRFRRLDSPAAGAPDRRDHPGVEVSAGAPGQGVATAVGLALAERMLAARFGRSLVDHRTWVLASAAELAEGDLGEAAALAGALRLEKLTILYDEAQPPALDPLKRFAALGWATKRLDGDDEAALVAALMQAARSRRPTLLACTRSLADQRFGPAARASCGWPPEPFGVPDGVRAEWERAGARGTPARRAWLKRLANHPLRAEFERAVSGRLAEGGYEAGAATRSELAEGRPGRSTASVARALFASWGAAVPELAVVAAEPEALPGAAPVSAESFGGRLLACGPCAGAMAALANGMALHGGLLPVVASTLVATDAMRPALRLAARMRQRVVFLLGDDSIGLGEDGAAFQPAEQLPGLRAVPDLHVLRPADAVETAECWELAMRRGDGPSLLLLSRQDVPAVRSDAAENRCARGGYVLAEAEGPRQATLIASGSEVAVALEARRLLAAEGVAVAVVSLPCWELFAGQDETTRAPILGTALRVGVEAASPFGWERWLGPDGVFVGMGGFGASAPGPDLFRHFGITPEAVASAVRKRLPQSIIEEGS